MGTKRFTHRNEQVTGALGNSPHFRERACCGFGIAFGADARRPLELPPLDLGIDALQLDLAALSVVLVAVDADDDALALLDVSRETERCLLDLVLDEALLDGRHGAAQLVDALDQLPRPLFELAGQRLHGVRASERVGRRRRPHLVLKHLLRAQRDPRRPLGRQGERLVERVRVQGLRAAANRRQRLHCDADDVELRLLGGERRAARLRMEAQRERPRVRGAEPLPHDACPQPAGRAELRNLLEEVVVGVEEERDALAELVGREAGRHRRLAVGNAVGHRERELLDGRRARLADVVAGDGDRVEERQPLRAVGEEVGRDPHRGPRREDVVPARDVLLEDVVLDGAAELVAPARPAPPPRARRAGARAPPGR